MGSSAATFAGPHLAQLSFPRLPIAMHAKARLLRSLSVSASLFPPNILESKLKVKHKISSRASVACCERPFCWRPPHHPSSSFERNRPSQKTGPTKRIGQVYSKVVTSLESGPGKEAFFPRCVIVTPRDVMSVQCQSKGLCSGGRDLQRRPLDSAKCLHIDVQAVQMGDCISLLHI